MMTKVTPLSPNFTIALPFMTASVSTGPGPTTTSYIRTTTNRPTYAVQTRTTQKTENNLVNQGALVPAPPQPPQYDLIDTTDNRTITVYNGHVFGDKRFASPAYKYLIPIILVICLLTTIFFAWILSKRLKRGSTMSRASCVLLLSVATADVLTLMSAISEVIFMYSQSLDNNMILSLSSCHTMLILERLSALPHAVSTWFTVILTIQRYVCVSCPFHAGKYIIVKRSMMCVLMVSVFSIGMHICRFVDATFVAVLLEHPSVPGKTIETCKKVYQPWIDDVVLYESLFAWTRIVIFQLLPCVLILIFVLSILKSLAKMKIATKDLRITASNQQSQRLRLSRFVVIIGTIVFCIEFSNAIFLSFNTWEISTGSSLLSYQDLKSASLGFDLALYLSYFLIFVLYCMMSGKFRDTLTFLFRHVKWSNHSKADITDSRANENQADVSKSKPTQKSFSISLSV